ncbi:MAG: hypothetical protein QM756_28285 [Polyangiaceae bacterium]
MLLFGVSACLPSDPESTRGRARGPVQSSVGPRLGAPESNPPRIPPSLRAGATTPRPSSSLGQMEVTGNRVLEKPFHDDFERDALGPRYRPTSGAWKIESGRVCVRGARNHPLWLLEQLPINAKIEFDAVTDSPDGDIKVEAWGDGRSAATTLSYTSATSYLFVLGGWRNTLHVLARIDEHGKDRSELRLDSNSDDPRLAPVEPGAPYHFVLERRDGRTLRFSVNEIELLNFVDPAPLVGDGHRYFAFNDWETRVCFDNLDILPLDG